MIAIGHLKLVREYGHREIGGSDEEKTGMLKEKNQEIQFIVAKLSKSEA